jgi:hypothetical protein
MYIVDSIGYLGYNILLLMIGIVFPDLNIPELFFVWIKLMGITGLTLCILSSFTLIKNCPKSAGLITRNAGRKPTDIFLITPI